MYINDHLLPEKRLEFVFDEYEILAAQIGEPEQIRHWLRYVSDYSILEIGISAADDTPHEIKLISVKGLTPRDMPRRLPVIERGLPQFNVPLWQGKKLMDFWHPVELTLDHDSALLMINDGDVPDRLIQNQKLVLATAGGRPCWIRWLGLTPEQVAWVADQAEGRGYYREGL